MEKSVDKIIALYNYIAELVKAGTKSVTDMSDHPVTLDVNKLPDDPDYIFCNQNVISGAEDCFFSIGKPELRRCPRPDKTFEKWLKPEWDNYKKDVALNEYIGNLEEPETLEYFVDDENRVAKFEAWKAKRDQWASEESVHIRTRGLFDQFYEIHSDFKADSESYELIIANGIFTDVTDKSINHPIITRRLRTSFDSDRNIIRVEDTDSYTELYTTLLREVNGINSNAIGSLEHELNIGDFFLIGAEANNFLNKFAHEISSECSFVSAEDDASRIRARFIISDSPVLIFRKRIAGTVSCIENIIKNINETAVVPAAILKLVGDSSEEIPEEYVEATISEQLAAVCGEDSDILLSKEANREQLEIAQRIEDYAAVVVEGPPGTGKTHTIANLLGHFLAQGKSILVTSYTKKALSVLKDKIEPGISDLCVSMLEDSNADMQRSIENIADKRARLSSSQLQKKIKRQEEVRSKIIKKLDSTREKIYKIKCAEQNSIVINGESLSPSEVAKFVQNNAKELSYIPGHVNVEKSLPLEIADLTFLYESNELISPDEEHELDGNMPSIGDLISPADFSKKVLLRKQLEEELNTVCEKQGWQIRFDQTSNKWTLMYGDESTLKNIDDDLVHRLEDIIDERSFQKSWQIKIAADGHKGDVFRDRWNLLFDCIESACEISKQYDSLAFGKIVDLGNASQADIDVYEKIKKDYHSNGKPSKFQMAFNNSYKSAHEEVRINGSIISNETDCDLIIRTIKLNDLREKCSNYWDELFTTDDVPRFFELNSERPEIIARKWIQDVLKYLNWTTDTYSTIKSVIESMGLDWRTIFGLDGYESSEDELNQVAEGIFSIIPSLHSISNYIIRIEELERTFEEVTEKLIPFSVKAVGIGKNLFNDLDSRNDKKYEQDYNRYLTVSGKLEVLNRRNQLISKLEPDAVEWATAISNRDGIHGKSELPDNIADAWKWNQYSQIIKELLEEPFSELIEKSVELSKGYRTATAKLAETKAWYYLIRRMEANNELGQNLEGWRQTVVKIGKGTGKNAPKLKNAARNLMGKCQNAVPCWIMTTNKAIESLKPAENHFDILIVDEASQADISSLAVAYMADKVIIVGDDKQVSPMAIGEDIDQSNKLAEMTIKDVIPNWHLFNSKLSLYDLAKQSYKPLMLKEHFRCVPDIIGYSNKLSYDFKIKPLRDSSSNLLPAMVPYRVKKGKKDGKSKTNRGEARTISALIKACMEQEEYKDKTFGVISLLGTEQAKLIYQRLISDISPAEMERRQILCGNASNFQGDERDVIILSMVDSNEKDGALPIANEGAEDWRKKRYNVAVSRARDQLWIVHSLDSANDLKPGDMRKDLLDYASNPSAIAQKIKKIEEDADSPFEAEVVKRLVSRGYNITQQWTVGAYSIDMVASCGNSRIAIECDGERWHSGEEKIREDMERQTILERAGWTFIRIRGSEFYTDKDATMERVFDELKTYNILPENTSDTVEANSSPLLDRIKNRVADILGESDEYKESLDLDTIEFALDDFAPDKRATVKSTHTRSSVAYFSGSSSNRRQETKLKQSEVKEVKRTASSVERTRYKSKAEKSKQKYEQISLFDSQKEKKRDSEKKRIVANTSKNIEKIITALNETGWEYIDNSENSDIIYLISDKANEDAERALLNTLNFPYEIEKRGTVATNNRRAWRIMVKEKEK